MANLKDRIEAAKTRVRKAEEQRTIALTQKENAQEQLKSVESKMAEMGVVPSTIEREIERLENEVNQGLEKVERLIPEVI